MNDEHAAHEDHMPVYWRTIVTLTVLTAVEFGVAIFGMQTGDAAVRPRLWVLGVVVLVALAAWKAVLVARFFMHLRYDPKILALIAATPVVLATPLVLFCIWDGTAGYGF